MVQTLHNQSKLETLADHNVANGLATTTWIERLSMNLFSYLIVILPIAFIVIAGKYKLFPKSIQSNALIQWFVYGSSDFKKEVTANLDGDTKGLLDKPTNTRPTQHGRQQQYQSDVRSSALEFIWCLLGLQVSYLIWGLLQEKIMTTSYPVNHPVDNKGSNSSNNSNHDLRNHLVSTPQPSQYLQKDHSNEAMVTFHDSQFLVFINRLVAFITAILGLVYTRRKQSKLFANRFANGSNSNLLNQSRIATKPQAPLYKYIYCSLSNILSSWSQYEALKYVNFPTQCLSKSCKVIPVMLMSRVLLRQRHPASDYCCALLLALGMFIFLLGQPLDNRHKHHEPNRDNAGSTTVETGHEKFARNSGLVSGLIILSLYLTFDSFTSNWQQSLYTQYETSNWQMMAAINFYSILLTLTSLHQLGSLRPALELLASSSSLLRDCLTMSVMSSIGQMFVYYTIKRFGSVLFAVIMTLRQLLSILISIIVFSHQITFESILGLVLVFSVAGYQVYHKSKRGNKRGAQNNQTRNLVTNSKRNGDSNSSETVLIEFNK